jgi:uncharacterized protein (DUF1778 family)
MATANRRLDFRLSMQAKAVIEQAAALSGQSVSEFAVSTLLDKANRVLEADCVRRLSERDAQLFMTMLDSEQGPNQALREAAAWYKEGHAPLAD